MSANSVILDNFHHHLWPDISFLAVLFAIINLLYLRVLFVARRLSGDLRSQEGFRRCSAGRLKQEMSRPNSGQVPVLPLGFRTAL